jgi:hypothetical protein
VAGLDAVIDVAGPTATPDVLDAGEVVGVERLHPAATNATAPTTAPIRRR